MKHDSSNRFTNSREFEQIQQQLVISLKFHHAQTFQKIPLEVALKAMMEAWTIAQQSKQ